jgi:hypothetical protein
MKILIAAAGLMLCSTAQSMAQRPAEPANLGPPPTAPSVAPTPATPAAPSGPAAAAKTVDLEACPEKGTEGDCVLIRFGEDVYDVTGADPKVPLNGKGVKLQGVIDPDTLGFCFGTKLKDIKWQEANLQCVGRALDPTPAPPTDLQVK